MDSFLGKLRYLLILVIVIVIGLSVPSFMTFNSKKPSIQNALKSIINYDFSVAGDVQLSLLPLPKITLNNVLANDEKGGSISVSKIIVYPSISTVFSDKIDITKLAIYDANLDLSDIQKTHNVAKAQESSVKIPNIELVDSSVTFDTDSGEDFKISGINAKLVFEGTGTKSLKFNSSFVYGRSGYNLDAQFSNVSINGDSDEATFSLHNDWFNLDFRGKLNSLFTSPHLDGKANFSVKPVVSNDKVKGLAHYIANDKLTSSADLLITKDIISVANFKLTSNSIAEGKGEFEWQFGFEQELDGAFSIDHIDLDTLFPKKQTETEEAASVPVILEEIVRPFINEFGLQVQKRIFGGVNFLIKEITYNQQKIENFELDFDLFNGEFALDNFKFTAPGSTAFSMNGNMSFNDVRPKFEGSSTLQIKDFVGFAKWLNIAVSDNMQSNKPSLDLKTKVDLVPRNLRLQNIKMSLGNTNVIGKASFKDTGEKRLSTKLTLRINEINSNDFGLSNKVDDLITQMYLLNSDSYGDKFTEYVNDYRWLRTFPISLTADLLIDKFTYKNKTFANVHDSFRVTPNNIIFDKFAVDDDALNLDGRLGLSLTAIKPNIMIDLKSQKMDWNGISSLFPSRDGLYKTFVSKLTKSDQSAINKAPSATDTFNFFSLTNFNSDFNVNFQNITNSSLPITGIVAQGKLDDGIFNFKSLKFNVFNGQLESIGSFSILNNIPSISFSYAINNFNPQAALWYFYGYNNFKGYMSANGVVTGTGYNTTEFLKNLAGNFNFVGRKVDFSGMDLSQLISTTESSATLDVRMDALRDSIKNGITSIDEMSGNMTFEKGVASLVNVSMSTNRARGAYSAQVDFINGQVKGIGKISFIPASSGVPLSIDLSNNGALAMQELTINTEPVSKYLQGMLQASEAAQEDQDKAQSLLRNRRL